MTENKRYKVVCDDFNNYSIYKDDKCIVFNLFKYDAERICDELNQLVDENEQLKKENELLKQDLEHCANQFKEDGKNVLLGLK